MLDTNNQQPAQHEPVAEGHHEAAQTEVTTATLAADQVPVVIGAPPVVPQPAAIPADLQRRIAALSRATSRHSTIKEPVVNNVEIAVDPASSVTDGERARFALREPELWNTTGTIRVFLAARHDEQAGLVTTSLPAMREKGLIPAEAKLDAGDLLLVEVKRVVLVFRINRANGASVAAVWPVNLQMPRWKDEGGSEFLEFPVTILGPVGFNKAPRVRAQCPPAPVGNVVVAQVEEVATA